MIYKAKYILFSIEVKQNFLLIHQLIAEGLIAKAPNYEYKQLSLIKNKLKMIIKFYKQYLFLLTLTGCKYQIDSISSRFVK